jgi:RNA polymerase sigma-70 factor (ECF subfamily)
MVLQGDDQRHNADLEDPMFGKESEAPPPLFWRGGREVRLKINFFLFGCNFLLPTFVLHPKQPTCGNFNYQTCMTEREYNECVSLYADNVYRFILKNLRHNEDAKDVVQGAFEKLWINRDKVDNDRSKSYLFTIAYNQMIDHVRKNKRVVLSEDFSENAKGATGQKHDAKRILNEALNKLSEKQRSLVLLKDYEGYSYEEIGQITGLNESQVKVYLHRARLILREYIVSPENVI